MLYDITILGIRPGGTPKSLPLLNDWLAANKLQLRVQVAHSVGDLLKTRGPRRLVTISPEATVADAIELMQIAPESPQAAANAHFQA